MKRNIRVKRADGYTHLLNDVQFLLGKAKALAYKAVDNIRVQTYWQIGERIVREELQHKGRADYGKGLVENLSKGIRHHQNKKRLPYNPDKSQDTNRCYVISRMNVAGTRMVGGLNTR